jgi:phenylacetate-coenzyme A ligase PaaK-like adenylate-forming protein
MQRVFADLCRRVIANALPAVADYRLTQRGDSELYLMADCSPEALANCQRQLIALFEQQGIATEQLTWRLQAQAIMPQFDAKRRRIVRLPEAG